MSRVDAYIIAGIWLVLAVLWRVVGGPWEVGIVVSNVWLAVAALKSRLPEKEHKR